MEVERKVIVETFNNQYYKGTNKSERMSSS